jgi:hypothetical protein
MFNQKITQQHLSSAAGWGTTFSCFLTSFLDPLTSSFFGGYLRGSFFGLGSEFM